MDPRKKTHANYTSNYPKLAITLFIKFCLFVLSLQIAVLLSNMIASFFQPSIYDSIASDDKENISLPPSFPPEAEYG